MILKFKEFIGLTTGRHNDYATAAYLPSDWTGSETFPNHIPHLSRTDLVHREVPNNEIRGRIRRIDTTKDPCRVDIDLPDGKSQTVLIHYPMLRTMVMGYKTPENAVGKEIRLTTQGFSKYGHPEIRWATITDPKDR